MQVQSIPSFADENPVLCQGDLWSRWIAHVCKKNAFPDGCTFRTLYVMNIKHQLRKTFVENSRLNFKRHLGPFQLVLQVGQGLLRTRRKVNTISNCEQPG